MDALWYDDEPLADSQDSDKAAGPEDAVLDDAALLVDDVTPEEVQRRIEALVSSLLAGLSATPPHAPTLELRSRQTAGAILRKRLLSRRDAPAVVRVWRVLAEIHANSIAGRSVTQRELYYVLADGVTVKRAGDVNSAIQDAVALLGAPRASLNITCASRGLLAGALAYLEEGVWRDLAAQGHGHAIPGSMAWVAAVGLRSAANFILVVEKHAVFNRLLQEGCCERLNAVMLTARGQPDLATRGLLARLHALLPDARVLALVDYNPSGLLILSTYRSGSVRMGLEAGRFAVPVRWLAARTGDLAAVVDDAMLALSPRDDTLIRNLLATPRFGADSPLYEAELRAMAARGLKAELEALYNSDALSSLTDILATKILRQDYL
jgi:meiotic recombination protein SPO11